MKIFMANMCDRHVKKGSAFRFFFKILLDRSITAEEISCKIKYKLVSYDSLK